MIATKRYLDMFDNIVHNVFIKIFFNLKYIKFFLKKISASIHYNHKKKHFKTLIFFHTKKILLKKLNKPQTDN